ncbi:MAG: PfkB family carbohydrate kinase [Kiritimatiellia bacterium]|jgi:D-beta-D-heptose 7-phosphate kinase/D-beta-D-heptose 1-phosphate adenosyltransferase|nr:PfkB family carbohydrate kinase [Kiritimatiellia bacterium]
MNKQRREAVLNNYAAQKILVVGDLMLDRYVYGKVNRISPEAPVPVVHVRDEIRQPGGAANVALNIQSLGGSATVAGIVGDDSAGRDLIGSMVDRGISVDGVLANGAVQTAVKSRIMAETQQVVRVDREDPAPQVTTVVKGLCDRMAELVVGSTGLIIEDYGKGVICDEVVKAALAAASDAGVPVGLDPKDNHALEISGIKLATPNYVEACDAAGLPVGEVVDDLAEGGRMQEIATRLLGKWESELIIVTLGSHGMYVAGRKQEPQHLPTKAQEVFDVSGAGDTVIAVALMSLASGSSQIEAAELANRAAGVVVGKVGTASCRKEEIL